MAENTTLLRQWPKLVRAFELRDQLVKWVEENNRFPEYDTEDNAAIATDPLIWQQWRVRPGSVPESAPAALLLGDIIQNWRSALDHQLWAITPEAVKTSDQARGVQFPLHEKKRDHRGWVKKWGDHYGPKVLEVVEAVQPYHAPTDQLDALAALKTLSNTDKHRMLNVVNLVSVDIGPIKIEPNPPTDAFQERYDGPLAEGQVLARLVWPRPIEGGYSLTVTPTFAVEYQLALRDPSTGEEEWHPLGDLLNFIGPCVTRATGALHNAYRMDSGLPVEA